jgi:diguanylate cyclase (GGDEF)-like protein/PAS domain S-box-containing protein
MTEYLEDNPASAAPTVGALEGAQPGCPDATLAVARQRNGSAPAALSEPPAGLFEAAALRESLDALQESYVIFEAVRDGQGHVIDLRYRFLNTAAELLYGRPSAEVLGRGLLELFPSVVAQGIFACYVAPLHTGRSSSMRVPWFDDGGVTGAFDVAAHPFGDGVVVTAHDVSHELAAQRSLAASEALLRVVLDSTSDAIMRFGPDLRVDYVNGRLAEFTGISRQDWVGKTFDGAGYPPDLTVSWDEYSRRVFATGEPVLHEFELDLPVGHRWFETRVDPEFGPAGVVAHVITTSRDVTERKVAETMLRDSAALLSVVLEGSADSTSTYGPDLRVEYVNRRIAELSGIPAEAWIGKSMGDMGYPPSSVAYWTAHFDAVFATGEPESMQYEVDNTEGHRWYEAKLSPVFGPDGSVAHVISTNRDITERVNAELSLRQMATHDPLTGLANRLALLDDIERGLRAGGRTSSSTAVLLIDLDRFKMVNDSLGHDVGDTLLIVAAQRLAGAVRGGDLVGRVGGDEFVVVMRDLADPAEAVRVAWRLVEAFRPPFPTLLGELFCTASIGVAVSQAASEPADLLREADTAMYAAKNDGRDRVAVFNNELREAVTARRLIESDLRHALERGQLAVWFQPEVDLVTGRVIAAEALLRWHHPSGETLTAARFIDVAEETGLINDIGDWVLRQACIQAASWATGKDDRPIAVRVNVSARQLAEGGLLDVLDDAIATTSLDPNLLCLEITETALLGETRIARDNLAGIHDRGVHIAIDDFGTGYASLSYLHRYPIDDVKIDRSFITGIATEPHDYRLVGALIAMANHLQLSVTAEGVEDEQQADRLRSLNCPSAQGYLYSQAIPPEQFVTLLASVFPHP